MVTWEISDSSLSNTHVTYHHVAVHIIIVDKYMSTLSGSNGLKDLWTLD